jgi:hypothetical protein
MSERLVDRFELLLVLVVATITAQGLIDTTGSAVGGLVTHAISGLSLVVAVRAGAVSAHWRRVADALVLGTLLLNVLVVVVDRVGGSPTVAGELVWLAAAALVPVPVVRRVFSHRIATRRTITGAVAAYLQIAVVYAVLFRFLDEVAPAALFGTAVPTTDYTYASLQTITTLGYGDVAPATEVGHLVAASEAVLGQVFLVTFVALVVARFSARDPADD